MNITKLPKEMQDAILALQHLHNIPMELALITVLGIVNFAAQGRYNVDSEIYGIVPLSLYLIGIMPTGASKSTTYRELMAGPNKYMDQERILLKTARERHKVAMKLYKKAESKYLNDCLAAGGSTGIIAPVEPAPISTCKYTTKKGTANGIIKLLETQPILGLFSSEGGEFFNSHAFQQGPKGQALAIEMAAFLTSLWDGHEIDKLTAMEQTDMRDRRFCMLLLLQESVIRDFLNNPTFADQGFTHRLLLTKCEYFKKPDLPKNSSEQTVFDTNEKVIRKSLQNFHDRIYELLDYPFAYRVKNNFELNLPALKQNSSAKYLLNNYFNKHQTFVHIGGKTFSDDKWEGFMNRIHEMPLRIAGNLAVFEKAKDIQLHHMEAAIDIWEFFVEQRKNLSLNVTPYNLATISVANELVQWIKDKKFDDTLGKFKNSNPKGIRKIGDKQFKEIVDEMKATGLVETYPFLSGTQYTEKIRCKV